MANVYSGQSSVLGAGRATAQQIDLWFAANGPAAAKTYAPDKKYKPAPTGLGQMIIDACTFPEFGITVNWDLVAGDIAKECAYWQSAIVRKKNNPSGLGATNDDPSGKAKKFATPFDGILATVAHMLVYFVGEGPWTKYDPRASAVRSAGWMGIAKRLSDLDGRWASPGHGYGASIAVYGNKLLDTPVDGGNNVTAQIPGFVWHPAKPTHYDVGRTAKIRGGAQHYSDGTNSLAWLTETSGMNPPDPKKRVSATFLVKHNPTLEDRGWQLVRIEDTAWTTAFANPYTVSIEYEHDGDQPIPDSAYTVLAQTWLDVRAYLQKNPHLGSIDISRDSIRGHKEWVNNPTLTCPDGVDVDRIVQRMHELDKGGSQLPDEEKFPTGYTLIGAFLNLYRKAREADVHWKTIGVPIGPEIRDVPVAYTQPDGTTKVIASVVQQTDRGGGWLLWNPETDIATMATSFEREQIERHLGLTFDIPVDEYVATLEALVAQMRSDHAQRDT